MSFNASVSLRSAVCSEQWTRSQQPSRSCTACASPAWQCSGQGVGFAAPQPVQRSTAGVTASLQPSASRQAAERMCTHSFLCSLYLSQAFWPFPATTGASCAVPRSSSPLVPLESAAPVSHSSCQSLAGSCSPSSRWPSWPTRTICSPSADEVDCRTRSCYSRKSADT